MLASFGVDLQSIKIFQIFVIVNVIIKKLFQPIRNDTNVILGDVWFGRSREFRTRWYKNIYQILGNANVWNIFSDKHRSFIKSLDRHDESFLSVNIRTS